MFKYRDESWYDDKCFPPKVIKKKLKKKEEEKSRYEFYPNKLGKAVY